MEPANCKAVDAQAGVEAGCRFGELCDADVLEDALALTIEARCAAPAVCSPEALEAVRRQAREIIAGGRPVAGLEDARKLSLAIGRPAACVLFEAMVANGTAPEMQKRALRRAIKRAFAASSETGCIKVDFYNPEKEAPDVAYLLLSECSAGHDLSAQLHKLFAHVPEERHVEIRNHLSMLAYLGRTAYAQTLSENGPLVRRLGRHLPKTFDACALRIDPVNTTMYLGPDTRKRPEGWEPRVGIFVRLAADVNAPDET